MIHSLEMLSVAIAVAGCFTASVTDLRTGRIPNRLTGSMLLFSVVLAVLRMFAGEPSFLCCFALNFAFGFLVGITLWYLRIWSGGDAKLFWAVCALIPVYPSFLIGFLGVALFYNRFSFGLTVLFNLAVILLLWFFFAAAYRFARENNPTQLLEVIIKPFLYLLASFIFAAGLSKVSGVAFFSYIAVPVVFLLSIFEVSYSRRAASVCSLFVAFVGLVFLEFPGLESLTALLVGQKTAFSLALLFSAYAVGSDIPLSLYVPIKSVKKGMSIAEEVYLEGGCIRRRDVDSSVLERIKLHVNRMHTHPPLVGPRPGGLTERDLKELRRHEKALKGVVRVNLSFPLTPFLLLALLTSFVLDVFWIMLDW